MKEKENSLSIGKVNGIDIYAVTDDNGQTLVPVKPVCQAIGIDFEGQRQRIQRDRRLSSVAFKIKATGTDGKQYDMLCMPLQYTYGWIFSIESSMVAESAREQVEKYQDECYDVLYRHFFNRAQRQAESIQAEASELENLRLFIGQEKEIKAMINETKKRIDAIRAARLDDQPSIFD